MKLSNAIARRYFLHAHDTNHDTNERLTLVSKKAVQQIEQIPPGRKKNST